MARNTSAAGVGSAQVRAPSPQLADGIVTHVARTPVDVDLARAQHRDRVAAPAARGWRAVPVGDGDPYPDGASVEDTAVVVDDPAVLLSASAPRTADRHDDLCPGVPLPGTAAA